MKYWDYDDYDGSLEDTIQKLIERGKTIRNLTILKYAEQMDTNRKQKYLFQIKAVIFYD